MPKLGNDVTALRDYPGKATRREFIGGAAALATNPNTMPEYNGPITDPTIGLIAEEKRWRLLAVAARAKAETILFALPRDEWPVDFDDAPIMADASSLEQRADEIFDRIIATPASTLAGTAAKLEWGEGDPEVTEAVIADLRHWLRSRR